MFLTIFIICKLELKQHTDEDVMIGFERFHFTQKQKSS